MDGDVVVQVAAAGQFDGPDVFDESARLRQYQDPDQGDHQGQGDEDGAVNAGPRADSLFLTPVALYQDVPNQKDTELSGGRQCMKPEASSQPSSFHIPHLR